MSLTYNGAVLSMTNASISRAKGVGWTNSVAKVTDDVLHQANLKTWQMKAQFCDEIAYLNAGKETFL